MNAKRSGEHWKHSRRRDRAAKNCRKNWSDCGTIVVGLRANRQDRLARNVTLRRKPRADRRHGRHSVVFLMCSGCSRDDALEQLRKERHNSDHPCAISLPIARSALLRLQVRCKPATKGVRLRRHLLGFLDPPMDVANLARLQPVASQLAETTSISRDCNLRAICDVTCTAKRESALCRCDFSDKKFS
jgi:hypothetical protein